MTETTTPQALRERRPSRTPAHRAATHPAGPSTVRNRIGVLEKGTDDELEEDRGADPTPDWSELVPRGIYARRGKRLANLALLLVVAPFALALSIPIALINWVQFGDARSVLYKQPRVGLRGTTFWIYKFRTMREASQDAFASWSQGHDRLRVTRFGRFLRNTHLDELPQLLNILRGEMDFVGPRPEMIEIDRWACENVPGFHRRNALLPGITGYAQVTQGYAGKDAVAYARKLAADELYRRRVSPLFDLEILLRTGLWMLRGRGWRWSGADALKKAPAEGGESLSETSAA